MSNITVALDAMSGDYGLDVSVPAAINVSRKYRDLKLILVGDPVQMEAHLKKYNGSSFLQLSLHPASQVVTMDDMPSYALRYKKDSSMRVAINLVKQGEAQACVSAGNTGALMGVAHFVLKTLPGIDRPAIIASIPANNPLKHVRVLDLGANVDSSAEQLVQFAIMGSVLTSAVDQIERPKVALLNIGEEVIKGNEQVKRTAKLLSESTAVNYIGFIEGDGVFGDEADVVVCDGFVGNVMLKTIEGSARFIRKVIENNFRKNIMTKLAGLCASPVLRLVSKEINPSLYNGASFVGLQYPVIKTHGKTDIKGFERAIRLAMLEANVPSLIKQQVTALLQEKEKVIV